MSEKARILLADDHALLRSGLRLLLSNQDSWEVVGEASTGIETLSLAEKLQPDLILLDLSMPGLDGLDTLPILHKQCPAARIIVLTMHDDPHYFRHAIQNGAAGYVLKKAADSELIAAIRAVLQGDIYVHSSMMRVFLEDMLPDPAPLPLEAWNNLSEREQSVLHKVALGYTSAEIAEQLNLSVKTVETYRARGMEKLKLQNRAALVRFALQYKLISHD